MLPRATTVGPFGPRPACLPLPVVAEDVPVFLLSLLSILRQFPDTLTTDLFIAVPPEQPNLFLILSSFQSILSSGHAFKLKTRKNQPVRKGDKSSVLWHPLKSCFASSLEKHRKLLWSLFLPEESNKESVWSPCALTWEFLTRKISSPVHTWLYF